MLARLEQPGCDSLARLARAKAPDIVNGASRLTGSTCWKYSPQAHAAIAAAIAHARSRPA